MRYGLNIINQQIALLENAAPWLAFLFLRLLIGWEFMESGLEKLHGDNWFMGIQQQFPFPFNIIPVQISWLIATWFELLGGAALIMGLGTRFFAISLVILTIVATSAVHWPADWQNVAELAMGYAISDKGYGNFKLPLLFIAMLLPLFFMGPGKLSLDALFKYFLIQRGYCEAKSFGKK